MNPDGTDTVKKVLIVIVGIALLLAVVVFAPFITIWSLNTLFNLGIDYTIWTWAATVWLGMVTFGGLAANVRNKE